MAGFSNSINKLSSRWEEHVPREENVSRTKKVTQVGAGKISKKRHIQITIEKPKKQLKKPKKKH